MFKRVLVPVDGSKLNESAVALVPQLAAPDGEVILVEVIDSAARILAQTTPAGFAWNDAGISANLVSDVIGAQRAAADQHLADASAQLAAAGLASVTSSIMEGIPGPAIVELAHDLGVDVVVMATHGRSGLRRTVLGSVADHVVRHLHGVPVLLVHPDGELGSANREPANTAAATR